jgi:hypothetical protein
MSSRGVYALGGPRPAAEAAGNSHQARLRGLLPRKKLTDTHTYAQLYARRRSMSAERRSASHDGSSSPLRESRA